MDIQFAYNLERMLYYISEQDASIVSPIMQEVEKQYRFQADAKGVQLTPSIVQKIRTIFLSASVSDTATRATIREVYRSHGVLLCPHSAIAVHAGRELLEQDSQGNFSRERSNRGKVVCVLTANPCKFVDTVQRAIAERDNADTAVVKEEVIVPLPPRIRSLEEAPERYTWLRKSNSAGNEWREEWINSIKMAIASRALERGKLM